MKYVRLCTALFVGLFCLGVADEGVAALDVDAPGVSAVDSVAVSAEAAPELALSMPTVVLLGEGALQPSIFSVESVDLRAFAGLPSPALSDAQPFVRSVVPEPNPSYSYRGTHRLVDLAAPRSGPMPAIGAYSVLVLRVG